MQQVPSYLVAPEMKTCCYIQNIWYAGFAGAKNDLRSTLYNHLQHLPAWGYLH